MQLILEVKKQIRGGYGGAIGYFNSCGDLDSCIVIYSVYVEDEVAETQAGAVYGDLFLLRNHLVM